MTKKERVLRLRKSESQRGIVAFRGAHISNGYSGFIPDGNRSTALRQRNDVIYNEQEEEIRSDDDEVPF